MIYSIENEKIKLSISDLGAEMQSIINKSNGAEYLWQGDEKYWSGRAYNLFPICGRFYEGKYTYRGKEYEMKIHGFARASVFDVVEQSENSITFELKANQETLAQYPFVFTYRITYIIEGNKIKTVYSVKNEGKDEMFFAVGAHPGFNVPLSDGEKFDDYYIEFDCVKPIEMLVLDIFYSGRNEPYALKDGKIYELSHKVFDEKSQFFTNMCASLTLKSKKSNAFVRMEFPGFRNLGFWQAPNLNSPYICIEPWTSLPSDDGRIDDLETKRQMEKLGGGEEFSIDFDIIIG